LSKGGASNHRRSSALSASAEADADEVTTDALAFAPGTTRPVNPSRNRAAAEILQPFNGLSEVLDISLEVSP